MAPSVPAGHLEQLPDFGLGQVFPGPIGGIRLPGWHDGSEGFAARRQNCPFFSGWGGNSELWFHWGFCPGWGPTVVTMAALRTVGKGIEPVVYRGWTVIITNSSKARFGAARYGAARYGQGKDKGEIGWQMLC